MCDVYTVYFFCCGIQGPSEADSKPVDSPCCITRESTGRWPCCYSSSGMHLAVVLVLYLHAPGLHKTLLCHVSFLVLVYSLTAFYCQWQVFANIIWGEISSTTTQYCAQLDALWSCIIISTHIVVGGSQYCSDLGSHFRLLYINLEIDQFGWNLTDGWQVRRESSHPVEFSV